VQAKAERQSVSAKGGLELKQKGKMAGKVIASSLGRGDAEEPKETIWGKKKLLRRFKKRKGNDE